MNKSAYETTTLKTTVTQKKSNGLYEPVAVDAEAEKPEATFAPSGSKPGLTLSNGENDGDLEIKATGKTSGKIVVKKANWREEVKVSYSVKESSKDVIEGSTKTVILNTNNADSSSDKGQEVTLTLNGGDDLTGVTAAYPKKWSDAGVEIDGISESGVSNELTVKLGEGTHKKGNYNVVFKSSNGGKFTLKVTVSTTELSKAVKLTVKSKMDITTGQKMVVVPTLKAVGGPIEDVTIETEGNFGCTYNATTNQIIVTQVNANLTAGKYTQVFHVKTATDEVDVELKNFQVTAKKPAVKVANVSFKKTQLGTVALDGKTNVLATYKQGGKTFSTEPYSSSESVPAVKFTNGTEVTEGDYAGYFLDSKTNAYVKYDAESGAIEVKTVSGSKKGTVKVEFMFRGQTKPIKKSFKINAVK